MRCITTSELRNVSRKWFSKPPMRCITVKTIISAIFKISKPPMRCVTEQDAEGVWEFNF